jgi:hypothetical protein
MSATRRIVQDWLRAFTAELEPLWVPGLALLQVLLGSWLLPFEGESYEWGQYLLLGTAFPAVVLATVYFSARAPALSRGLAGVRLALTTLCLVYPCVNFLSPRSFLLVGVAAAQGIAAVVLLYFQGQESPVERGGAFARSAAGLVVVCVSWLVCVRFVWWMPFFAQVRESRYTLGVFVAATLLVLFGYCRRPPEGGADTRKLRVVGDLLSVVILGLASLRLDAIEPHTFGHWGVIVGPAEMVRRGGWLLWDVPSQYGFLSTLTVAWLPAANIWQSLYILNSFMLFGSASILYFLLRSGRRGLLALPFCLAVTLACVFLIPGYPPLATGPAAFPSVAAFRFFWCYALVAVLLWESGLQPGSRRQALALGIGCLLWLLGSLWSAESGTYSIAVWLPAFGVMVWRRAAALQPQGTWLRGRVFPVITWYLLPISLCCVAFLCIHAYYFLSLGHGPDWGAWFEYARAFQGEAFAMPIDPNGTVWTLFLVFGMISSAVVVYIARQGIGERLPLLTGAWGALWVVSSYFVSRSSENNATNLSPFLCLAAAVALHGFSGRPSSTRFAWLMTLSFVPLFTLLLTASFGNEAMIRGFVRALPRGYVKRVERRLPVIDPSLMQLLRSAGAHPDDSIVFLDKGTAAEGYPVSNLLAAWPGADGDPNVRASSYRTWLPVSPLIVLVPLPVERQKEYLTRFAERTHSDGWLVQADDGNDSYRLWIVEQLQTTHKLGEARYRNGQWQIRRVEYRRAEDPGVSRAQEMDNGATPANAR